MDYQINFLRIITLFTTFSFLFSLAAQDYVEIEGTITDSETNFPLKYANIDIANNHIGTISNKNGKFRFKIPAEFIDEKVVFSYLGYQSYTLPVQDCLSKYLKVKLTISPVNLKTVDVTYYNPHELIKKAIQSVSVNYLNRSLNLHAFYREEVLENNEQIQFIEAVMEIYKGSYSDKKDKDRIRILKAREEVLVKKSVFFDYLFFVDGPYEALFLDIAKYPYGFIKILQNSVNFLNPKHFKYYDYESVEVAYDNGSKAHYIINFKPKSKKALLSGQIVIDKLSFAFVAVEFYLDKDKINKAQLIKYDNEDYINSEGFYTKAVDYNCKAAFKKYNELFVLSNSKIDYSFLFINSVSSDTLKISNSIDFVVTKIDSQNVTRFKLNKSVWKNVALTKQLGQYDPDFWENYNVIKLIEDKKD